MKKYEQKLLNNWWAKVLMAVILGAVSYGFASLAIDSGNLIDYVLTIFFFAFAIKSVIDAIRNR